MIAAFALASLLSASPARAAAPDYAELDRLYFHRDQGDNLASDIAQLDAGLTATPDDAALLWRRGRALIRRGEKKEKKAERLSDYVEAEKVLERATTLAPNDVDAHYWLGVGKGRRGETQGILNSLFLIKPIRREMAEVLRIDQNHGGAHRVLGEILWQVPGFAGGDKKKAVEELEASVRLSPRYTSNYVKLAEYYRHFGRTDDAVKTLKAVVDMKDPDDPAAYPEDLADAKNLLDKIGH